jgi:hypothetical protein
VDRSDGGSAIVVASLEEVEELLQQVIAARGVI